MTSKSKKIEATDKEEETEDCECTYCEGKFSDDHGGEPWIKCLGCHLWAHELCAGAGDIISEDGFYCISCPYPFNSTE